MNRARDDQKFVCPQRSVVLTRSLCMTGADPTFPKRIAFSGQTLLNGWACMIALLVSQVATASTLPMQNQFDPRHLDLDPAPAGNGLFVAPGTTLEQSFGDALNSAEDWYAEFLIANPSNQAIAFSADLVWPGGGTQGPGLLQPGFAFVLKVDPTDVPETKSDWLFTFTNPLSVDLIVDASVSEALSLTQNPGDGFGFFTIGGEPAGPNSGNFFDPGGPITSDAIILGVVPEPTSSMLLLLAGLCIIGRGHRTGRPKTS